MKAPSPTPTSRPRRLLVALGLVLLLAVGGWAVVARGGASCQAWQDALRQRSAADVALVGAPTAQQFQREAIATGRIDQAGRAVVRPAGCHDAAR